MIKKDDLVKQFELLTKQEITNYKNDVSAIHNKMELILSNLETVKKNALLNNNQILSDLTKVKGELDNSKIEIQRFSSEFNSVKNMVGKKDQELKSYKTNLVDECNALRILHEKNQKRIVDIKKEYDLLELNISKYLENFNSVLESLHNKMLKKIDEKIDALKSEPKPHESQIKEIHQKLNIDRVDFDGVMRELKIIKRENEIKTKEIEKLYILIERMEKRGELFHK